MFHKTLWVIIICNVCLLPLNVYASSIKEDYELQERCGKRSEEWFKSKYGDGFSRSDDGNMRSHYKNHYNKKQNKCFILINNNFVDTNKKNNKDQSFTDKFLYDVNENGYYGSYMNMVEGSDCIFLEKKCKSEKEWDLLVKPYMEE